jgi:hypothetical protein
MYMTTKGNQRKPNQTQPHQNREVAVWGIRKATKWKQTHNRPERNRNPSLRLHKVCRVARLIRASTRVERVFSRPKGSDPEPEPDGRQGRVWTAWVRPCPLVCPCPCRNAAHLALCTLHFALCALHSVAQSVNTGTCACVRNVDPSIRRSLQRSEFRMSSKGLRAVLGAVNMSVWERVAVDLLIRVKRSSS